jgi:hypothetical protein
MPQRRPSGPRRPALGQPPQQAAALAADGAGGVRRHHRQGDTQQQHGGEQRADDRLRWRLAHCPLLRSTDCRR